VGAVSEQGSGHRVWLGEENAKEGEEERVKSDEERWKNRLCPLDALHKTSRVLIGRHQSLCHHY
jgi:hypothetical protein